MNTLVNSALFKNLRSSEISELLNKIKYKKIDLVKNQYVFDSFLSSNYIGLVLSGKVNIEKILPDGKSVFMYSKKKGDIFGEVAAFSDNGYYPCNVIASSKSSLIIFDKPEFFKMLTLKPTVLDNFLLLICNKAFSLNSRIGSLCLSSARQKIAQSLLYDFKIYKDLSIELPYSKLIWSEILNISRASLYRELTALSDENIISFDKSKNINILDLKKLQNILL